jgi:hypothetical protein
MKIPFAQLNAGDKFKLIGNPARPETLQKTDPVFCDKVRPEFYGVIYYNAIYLEGEHSGCPAVIPSHYEEGKPAKSFYVESV